GGLIQWNVEGITWESCCAFCDESVKDDDFPKALDRLKERALKSYKLQGGKYTEGTKSPLDGAIVADAKAAPKNGPGAAAGGNAEPAWLKGQNLKPTYNEGVGLIFAHRCIECHHPGAVAPMSFMSYNEIKKWTKSMKNSVGNREMPPWPADPSVGAFANSRALSQKEYDILMQWINAGYPIGDGSFTSPPAEGTGDNEKPDAVPAGATAVKAENTALAIPAGAENYEAKASYELKDGGKIVPLTPVMNQRGKAISVFAKTPDGKRTELLRIAHWVNDWKFRYDLAAPFAAPKGTVIEAEAKYDNSKLNAANPDATKEVKNGAGPDGELLEVWIGYTK
ncbi:cytochrome c, partial [Candidatus Sumerlaeota bacterium]|nr:cytochrome c [Candidatus Sumerlaeota bacterium]